MAKFQFSMNFLAFILILLSLFNLVFTYRFLQRVSPEKEERIRKALKLIENLLESEEDRYSILNGIPTSKYRAFIHQMVPKFNLFFRKPTYLHTIFLPLYV